MPLTETVAMSGVKAAGLDYGRMRLWGSLSFIAAEPRRRLGGGRAWVPPPAIWLVVGGGVLTDRGHARPGTPRRARAAEGGDQRAAPGVAERWGCCIRACSCCSCWPAGAVQAAHAVFYTFGTLHWRALGLSTGLVRRAVGDRGVAEVGAVRLLGAVVRRFGAGAS